MQSLTIDEIRDLFPGSRPELKFPNRFYPEAVQWQELDFFGWEHPSKSHIVFFVIPYQGLHVGLIAEKRRLAPAVRSQRVICGFCATQRQRGDIASYTFRPARNQSTTLLLCRDLGCSGFVRGSDPGCVQPQETLGQAEKIDRLRANLERYVQELILKTREAVA